MYSLISFGNCLQLFNHYNNQDTGHFNHTKNFLTPLLKFIPSLNLQPQGKLMFSDRSVLSFFKFHINGIMLYIAF